LQSENMRSLVKDSKVKAIAMHSLSVPAKTDLSLSDSDDPIIQLKKWWQKSCTLFEADGISEEQLIFDPGIGFGKTKQQSLYILNHLEKLGQESDAIKNPVLIGHSRKSYQTIFSDRSAEHRDLETSLITKDLNLAFTQYLRVHDIETQKMALRL